MATLIALALVIVAAVAVGWWLLANRPASVLATDPEQAPPDDMFTGFTGRINYGQHALDEMKADGLTLVDVREALANADEVRVSEERGSVTVTGTDWSGRRIKVVVTGTEWPRENITLITVTQKGDPVEYVPVPPDRVGRIVGKRGWQIKKIADDTGADVRVTRRTTSKGKVYVEVKSPIWSLRRDAKEQIKKIAYPQDGE